MRVRKITSVIALSCSIFCLFSGCASGPAPQQAEQKEPTPLTSEALFQAADNGDPKQIREILDAKPELVNVRDAKGRTPLHHASNGGIGPTRCLTCYNLFSQCAQILLERGADVRAKDSGGWTALHYVAAYNFTPKDQRASFILNGEPLADYVDRMQMESLKLLLEKNPEVNATNNLGETALHYASMTGRIEMVRLLLASGADKTIRESGSGLTALDLARGAKQDDVVRLLEAQ